MDDSHGPLNFSENQNENKPVGGLYLLLKLSGTEVASN